MIKPADVGLVSYGRRRVPGLRRDEAAHLAGVSVDYYVRFEQGRSPGTSDSVLNAIAQALRLDAMETRHARPAVRSATSGVHRAHPSLARMVETLQDVPTFVQTLGMDFIAWNPLADAVAGFSAMPAGRCNSALHLFLDPTARDFYVDWTVLAEALVGNLRLTAGEHPHDPRLQALVGELTVKSEEFRALWASYPVSRMTSGPMRINHPVAGIMDLRFEALTAPDEPDQLLVSYIADPGSPTAEKLRRLAGCSDDDRISAMPRVTMAAGASSTAQLRGLTSGG
jgi:hypothetical protein